MMTDTQQTPTRPQGEARTQMRKCGLLLFHSGIFMQLCTVTAVCCFYSSPPCPPPPFSLQLIVVIANTLHLNMAFMPQMLRFLHYTAKCVIVDNHKKIIAHQYEVFTYDNPNEEIHCLILISYKVYCNFICLTAVIMKETHVLYTSCMHVRSVVVNSYKTKQHFA